MFCRNCGKEIGQDVNFCKNCGISVNEAVENVLFENADSPKKKERFNLWKTFLYSTGYILLIILIPSAILGGFESDGVSLFFGILIISILLGLLLAFVIKMFKNEPKKQEIPLTEKELLKYKGLQGWLIIVLLGLIVSGLYNAYSFIDSFNSLSNGEFASLADKAGDYYNPSLLSFIQLEMILSLVVAIFSVYLIYIFSKAKKSFPRIVSIFWIVSALWLALDYVYAQSISTIPPETLQQAGTDVGKAFFQSLIWISYMATSKRVRATFINN